VALFEYSKFKKKKSFRKEIYSSQKFTIFHLHQLLLKNCTLPSLLLTPFGYKGKNISIANIRLVKNKTQMLKLHTFDIFSE